MARPRARQFPRGETPPRNPAVPTVFHDLLREDRQRERRQPPLKRRRVGDRSVNVPALARREERVAEQGRVTDTPVVLDKGSTARGKQKVVEEEPASLEEEENFAEDADDDETEFDWEDVDLIGDDDQTVDDGNGDLTITLGEGSQVKGKGKGKARGRKPLSSVEKQRRLLAHKMHVLCLLFHCFHRNNWCNDAELQRRLLKLKLVTRKNLEWLHTDSNFSQRTRSERLKEALKEICAAWQSRFMITAPGMRRPRWIDDPEKLKNVKLLDNAEIFTDRTDFRKGASDMEGSADYGAQLFCALLRGLELDARLVCSFQPLPFSSIPLGLPGTSRASYTFGYQDTETIDLPTTKPTQNTTQASYIPSPFERLYSRVTSRIDPSTVAPARRRSTLRRPHHPIFWVEVLDTSYQKWIPVDPISTKSVNLPSHLEPPLTDPDNALSYAIAFEEDGVARDVTRRYARAYNSKTRRLRVESTDGGDKWLRSAMRFFARRKYLVRDQIEDSQLAQKEAAEGLPKSIQDFKNHPVYVLERHLKHNEVIHPKHEVGRFGQVTKHTSPRSLLPIYRRSDVHVVRSADRWFRAGRDVKPGETPLKIASKRTKAGKGVEPFDEEDILSDVPLYAYFQTVQYVAPPVVDGMVPRNAFGNVDVYVPSMIPPGGVQVLHSRAREAARLLGISYADAVTGFRFKGRGKGEAVVRGVVVAKEFAGVMGEVLEGLVDVERERGRELRKVEALRLWRRFVVGLRVVERVKERYGDEQNGESGEEGGGDAEEKDIQGEIDREIDGAERMAVDGGFFFDAPGLRVRPSEVGIADSSLGGEDDQAIFIQGPDLPPPERKREDPQEDLGGGFLANDLETLERQSQALDELFEQPVSDNEGEGGGFMREESSLRSVRANGDPSGQNSTLMGQQQNVDPQTNEPLETSERVVANSPEMVETSQTPEKTSDQNGQGQQASPGSGASVAAESMLSHDPDDDDDDEIPDWLL